MALISCPECGKEISNKSQTCIYCGCPIHGVHNVTQIKETSKINKRVWVAALVFICVAALVVLTIGISANTLNGEEKHVLKLVEEYQSMLKDPDSLILRGSVVVFREHTDEKGPMEYSRSAQMLSLTFPTERVQTIIIMHMALEPGGIICTINGNKLLQTRKSVLFWINIFLLMQSPQCSRD